MKENVSFVAFHISTRKGLENPYIIPEELRAMIHCVLYQNLLTVVYSGRKRRNLVFCLDRPTLLHTVSHGMELCCARSITNSLPGITFIYAGCQRFLAVLDWLKPFQFRRFVLINHSRSEDMKRYHGRAINIRADDDHVPFHGAFLIHEMRVLEFSPIYRDRATSLPIVWAEWHSSFWFVIAIAARVVKASGLCLLHEQNSIIGDHLW